MQQQMSLRVAICFGGWRPWAFPELVGVCFGGWRLWGSPLEGGGHGRSLRVCIFCYSSVQKTWLIQSWLSIHTVQRSSMSLQMINKDVLLPKSCRLHFLCISTRRVGRLLLLSHVYNTTCEENRKKEPSN